MRRPVLVKWRFRVKRAAVGFVRSAFYGGGGFGCVFWGSFALELSFQSAELSKNCTA
jgi:hypothetical protein